MRPMRARWVTKFGIVGILLTIQAALLAWIDFRNSPSVDEVAHLPAGLRHLRKCTFDIYQVNPPLVRLIAASPLLLCSPQTDWTYMSDAPYARTEFATGIRFCNLNAPNVFWYFTIARWACIPLILAGGYAVYRWSADLYGWRSACIATTLWCFSPSILGNGGMITPDAAAAALGVLASYCFWRWLKEPSWTRCALAGAALGLALLSKTTWAILVVLWPILWCLWRLYAPRADSSRSTANIARFDAPVPTVGQLAVLLFVGIDLLNLAYCFEGTFTPLSQFAFRSTLLGGPHAHSTPGNLFATSWIGNIWIPLPFNYVQGIDIQRYDFELGNWSYLWGVQRFGGWWYWYLFAVVVKEPLPLLLMLVLATVVAGLGNSGRRRLIDEAVLLIPAIVLFAVVSSQTGFSRYERYVLPAFPFLLIWASRSVELARPIGSILSIARCALVSWYVASSLFIFPHSLSYFNELAGGPFGGPRYLLDGNVDWGQDLLFMKRWSASHPEARPLFLQYFGFLDPASADLDARLVPTERDMASRTQGAVSKQLEPGWYAISVNDLFGYKHKGDDEPPFAYLRSLRRAASAGYSIYIFRVSDEESHEAKAKANEHVNFQDPR
jgi:hypothetical protein